MPQWVAIVGLREPKPNATQADKDEFQALARLCIKYIDHELADGDVVITGDASGIDAIARYIAICNEHRHHWIPALWDEQDRKAGPWRNEVLVRAADRVVAFWNGRSPGTRSSINLTKRYKKPLLTIYPDGRREES